MSIARPELGPSLPELVGPRLRRSSRRFRWALAALVVLLVLAVVAVWLHRRPVALEQAVVRGPLTFNTRFDDRIQRVATAPGELLHLKTRPGPGRGDEDLVFRDAGPAPTRDEPAGGPVAQLALRMAAVMRPAIAGLEGYQVRSQGRVKIGRDYAGWLVRYQFRRAGHTWFGLRILLLPDLQGVRGRVLDVSLQSERSQVVSNISEAGSNGPMRTPVYGVAFGTEAP
ncbi:hypothetical protein ACVU7I_13940 [Patulibacter sp. S7RM1-6]